MTTRKPTHERRWRTLAQKRDADAAERELGYKPVREYGGGSSGGKTNTVTIYEPIEPEPEIPSCCLLARAPFKEPT